MTEQHTVPYPVILPGVRDSRACECLCDNIGQQCHAPIPSGLSSTAGGCCSNFLRKTGPLPPPSQRASTTNGWGYRSGSSGHSSCLAWSLARWRTSPATSEAWAAYRTWWMGSHSRGKGGDGDPDMLRQPRGGVLQPRRQDILQPCSGCWSSAADCQYQPHDVSHRVLERPCAKDGTCICGIPSVGDPKVLHAVTLTGSGTAKHVGS